MAATDEQWLPSVEELTVPELEVTSPVLRAGAHHLGKYCDELSKEFMLCIKETGDPRICLPVGKQLTGCAFEFFGKVKRHCYDDFTKYWQCVDHATTMELKTCRKTQKLFDKCVLDNLGQERPVRGYFSQTRIHDTKRPKGEQLKPHKLPDKVPELITDPDSKPYPERFKGKDMYW